MLRPVLTLPLDPIAVAEITTAAIRADARTGGAVPLSPDALYLEDPRQEPNHLLSPAEVAARGGGKCFDLVRAEGGYRGTHVGCVRSPGGLHVFLAFMPEGQEPIHYDISKLRGMPGEPDYDGAVYAAIWQPGPGGTAGPPGHDQPPQALIGAAALPAPAWADFVTTIGGPLVGTAKDTASLLVAVEQELGKASTVATKEALAALALVARALTDDRARTVVTEQLRAIDPKAPEAMGPAAAKLIGALAVLSGRPWRSLLGARTQPPAPAPRMIRTPTVTFRPVTAVLPGGSCPGSCAIPRR